MSSNDLDQDRAKSTDRVSTTENDITEEPIENIQFRTISQESVFENYKSEEELIKKSYTPEEGIIKQKSLVNTENVKTDEVLTEEKSFQDAGDHLVRYSTVNGDQLTEDEEVEEQRELHEEKKSKELDLSIPGSLKENEKDDFSASINFEGKDLVSEVKFNLSENSEVLEFSNFSEDNVETEDKGASESLTNISVEDAKRKSVRISVDFVRTQSMQSRFTLSSLPELEEMIESSSEFDENEEDEEKDVTHVEEQEDEDIYRTIDRAMYYQMHTHFDERHRKEKMQNNFLQARLAGYYMRRKMLYVLREQTFHVVEMQAKYEKELDALENLSETSEREKELNGGELHHLNQKRGAKLAHLKELFEKLQNGELEYGRSLTFDKTGKNNMDKVTERFIKRQKNQVALLAQMRLKFIKLRNKMQDKLKALDALDNLGPGFRIMDFVQLKVDNRDLRDKLEEKEGELSRLRKCCQNTMQILAHIREKTAAVDIRIQQMKDELETVTAEYEDAREHLHCLRHSRDEVRDGIKNLKLQFGLLANKKALLDMEHSVNELTALKEKLETTKAEYIVKSNQLRAVRKNIEIVQETKRLEDEKSKEEQVSNNSSL